MAIHVAMMTNLTIDHDTVDLSSAVQAIILASNPTAAEDGHIDRFALAWSPSDHAVVIGDGSGLAYGLWLAEFTADSEDELAVTALAHHLLQPGNGFTTSTPPELALIQSQALFVRGGTSWQQWNTMVRDAMIARQDQNDSCARSSWLHQEDHNATTDMRFMDTVHSILTLQTYYRYRAEFTRPVTTASDQRDRAYQ